MSLQNPDIVESSQTAPPKDIVEPKSFFVPSFRRNNPNEEVESIEGLDKASETESSQ